MGAQTNSQPTGGTCFPFPGLEQLCDTPGIFSQHQGTEAKLNIINKVDWEDGTAGKLLVGLRI